MQQVEPQSLRKEERFSTDRVILFRPTEESDFRPARLKNISHHGLFMRTSELLSIGEQVEVIISPFDCTSDPVQVTVEVVHMQITEQGAEQGYGCKVTSSNTIENGNKSFF